jgi:hypothetical protein
MHSVLRVTRSQTLRAERERERARARARERREEREGGRERRVNCLPSPPNLEKKLPSPQAPSRQKIFVTKDEVKSDSVYEHLRANQQILYVECDRRLSQRRLEACQRQRGGLLIDPLPLPTKPPNQLQVIKQMKTNGLSSIISRALERQSVSESERDHERKRTREGEIKCVCARVQGGRGRESEGERARARERERRGGREAPGGPLQRLPNYSPESARSCDCAPCT